MKKEGMNNKLFFGVYNPSIILTYIGVFFALFGLKQLLIFDTTANKSNALCMSIIALAVSGLCDLFDGAIARKCKRTDREIEFGIQLDSLADTTSFVVLPICILMHSTGGVWHSMVVACLYAFSGIMRLGWFNIMVDENKGIYQGLPVTTISLILPVVYFFMQSFNITNQGVIIECVMATVAALFITNFKFKKPKASSIVIGIAVILFISVVLIGF